MRQFAFDVFTGPDKVLRVVVVFINPGRDGKDVRVKDNIFRREAHLFGKNLVRPTADLNFARAGVGLALLVKGHHHHCSTVATQQLRVMDKGLNPLFHRDGVNDAFTLNALQPFFDYFPFRGVDHNRHAGDIRFTGNQVEETNHRRFGVEHPLIHVDIDDLRAAFHLLTGDVQRLAVFLFFDQALKLRRTGNVGTLADVHKQAVVADVQRLKAGKAAGNRDFRQAAWRQAIHRAAHGSDVFRRGAAAAANNIQEARLGPFADLRRHGVGIEIVLTKCVRQPGVRVRGHVAFGNARQFLHVLAQFVRA